LPGTLSGCILMDYLSNKKNIYYFAV